MQNVKRKEKAAQARAQRDAEYRRMLGVAYWEELPGLIGSAASSGAARGGRGRSQTKQAKARRRRMARE